MSEVVQNCPLCHNVHFGLFDRREFRGQKVSNQICLRCGLVFQSPRMTIEESAVFYESEYRKIQEGDVNPTQRNQVVQQARARYFLEFIHPLVPGISRHLDIGCSTGVLLKHIQKEYRNQAVGVEPGDAHRERAAGEGLKVYASLEALEQAGEPRFDLISMSHVLEHLPQPVEYLTHLREKLLTLNGHLLIEVPNLYAHDSFEAAHLIAFSPQTLSAALRQAGYEIMRFEKHGQPNSAILPLFLAVFCRPVLEEAKIASIRPERGVKFKRFLGMFWRSLVSRLLPRQAWLRLESK